MRGNSPPAPAERARAPSTDAATQRSDRTERQQRTDRTERQTAASPSAGPSSGEGA